MDSRKEDYAAEAVCAVSMDSFMKHTAHSVNRVVSSLLLGAHLSFKSHFFPHIIIRFLLS